VENSYCVDRSNLDRVGINTVFHDMLLDHELSLETLRSIDDDRFVASELEKAGVTRLQDRVKIINAVRKMEIH
jgi:hypothetical protein